MKKSIFERQKEEAEAKKAREQAENAAALEEFVKSFEDDTGRPTSTPSRHIPSGPGKRHFTSSALKSGPGSLGPAPALKSGPGSLGPSFNRKRHYDDYKDRRDRADGFGYREERKDSVDQDRDTDDKATARPTIQLSSLPPSISVAAIKALLVRSPLNIEDVRIVPVSAAGHRNTERRTTSAIITLTTDTPAADIDAVVSQLQNRYVGYGFHLSISRHLSSTALANVGISAATTHDLPFGAKIINQQSSLSRAPPPGHRYAPPSSYAPSSLPGRTPSQVSVQNPSDLKQLKLIHKMLESLLNCGPEFEALLMSRPEVQQDERWAWLWNSRSAGGVYYRWRLWEILTNAKSRKKHGRYTPQNLFEGQSLWQPPEEGLNFEYTTRLEQFVSDEDYNSSDEEDNDMGIAARYTDHNAGGAGQEDGSDGTGYLNPLARSKLVHLLSRLPDTTAKLRRGDVVRITAFAIEHAGAGAEEVAGLVTRNIIQPFNNGDEEDQSSASQVGLYVVSDILSCSASAGVRHAWRYRTLFENTLRQQQVWEKLGRAEKDYSWGKLKAEKWKRSIQMLLNLWEGWSVFPHATHEEFSNAFMNPPLTDKERAAAEAEEKRKAEDEAKRNKGVNRWKSVDDDHIATTDVDMADVDGTAMNDTDDSDRHQGMNVDIDGVPMIDSSDEEEEEEADKASPDVQPAEMNQTQTKPTSITSVGSNQDIPTGPRQRPRAADMFADDSE